MQASSIVANRRCLPAATVVRPAASAERPAAPLNVVTFNTGSDDDMQAPQAAFTNLPMFQAVINGRPDAPILSLQEAGDTLAKKLIAEAQRTGNFQVVWTGKTYLPSDNKLITPFTLGTLVLVPKRFKVTQKATHYYRGRQWQLLEDLWQVVRGKLSLKTALTDEGRRGYQELQLVDTTSGRPLTLINTHISYYAPARERQAAQLREAVTRARARGPVIVTGDFNTSTRDTNTEHDPRVERFWQTLDPAGLQDMGPRGAAGASDWKSGHDLDQVLASGFTSTASRLYTGSSMPGIPGRLDARDLSDHYAEGDTLAWS